MDTFNLHALSLFVDAKILLVSFLITAYITKPKKRDFMLSVHNNTEPIKKTLSIHAYSTRS